MFVYFQRSVKTGVKGLKKLDRSLVETSIHTTKECVTEVVNITRNK